MHEERRRAVRHSLEARVSLDRGLGLTSDISGLGVLFRTDVALQPDEPIEFTLAIPGAADVRCRGRVVRSTGEPPTYSVAATIDGYAIEGEAADESHTLLRDLAVHHPQGWEWGE